MLKVGVFLGSFRLGVKSGLDKCRELKLDGIELTDIPDEVVIERLTGTEIRGLKDLIGSYGLALSSTCGDLGGHQFTDESDVEERIVRTKKIMDNTRALGCGIVQTHIGSIPEDRGSKSWKVMQYAMDILGAHGDKIGCCLATETGPEEPALMKEFLDQVKHDSIKVNYDPANLAMKGFDQIGGVSVLQKYIVQTHAKDGRKNNGEVPLGDGDVNFPEYLKALVGIGFKGFYIIEREVGADPVVDIAKAVEFLRKF
ncbi:MAG: sugar phosphate isomerase/epimerase [Candidatus Omnitrophica bacterium]|nr:sugar phosphate isomerase/epimerase [Candidatus Omnitrophota bacterium]